MIVGVGNHFESCEDFKPSDFRSIAQVQYSGSHRVIVNETGRIVTLHLNGTGDLQLKQVIVCSTSGKSRTTVKREY